MRNHFISKWTWKRPCWRKGKVLNHYAVGHKVHKKRINLLCRPPLALGKEAHQCAYTALIEPGATEGHKVEVTRRCVSSQHSCFKTRNFKALNLKSASMISSSTRPHRTLPAMSPPSLLVVFDICKALKKSLMLDDHNNEFSANRLIVFS